MNERILELVKQATRVVDGGPDLWSMPKEVFDKEKFAELIVKECAKVARNTDLEDVEGGDGAVLRAASEAIENYFGVE